MGAWFALSGNALGPLPSPSLTALPQVRKSFAADHPWRVDAHRVPEQRKSEMARDDVKKVCGTTLFVCHVPVFPFPSAIRLCPSEVVWQSRLVMQQHFQLAAEPCLTTLSVWSSLAWYETFILLFVSKYALKFELKSRRFWSNWSGTLAFKEEC